MTQQWLFAWPSHSLFLRTLPAPASFLVMAIFMQRSRKQVLCWFKCRLQLFSSFHRHGVIRRTMASDPTATEITRFDFLVIGGGSGGLAGARRASELGASTAVIESHKLGGTCVSKTSTNSFLSSPALCRLCGFQTQALCLVQCETSRLLFFVLMFLAYVEHRWKWKKRLNTSALTH